MSQSLLAFDTDHIKKFVFGTNKLKEIRGASSLLDSLNRTQSRAIAEKEYSAQTIFAYGGSALFLLDSNRAEQLGKAIQKCYHEATGGGASLTYAIQPVPTSGVRDILNAEQLEGTVTMQQVLKLLRARLKLAKDTSCMNYSLSKQPSSEKEVPALTLPSHILLSPCSSCGVAYAEETWRDLDDPEEEENCYCQVCLKKREEDKTVRNILRNVRPQDIPQEKLWGRILHLLTQSGYPDNSLYSLSERIKRPKDFHAFRDFASGKEYLGLIYADANGMGQVLEGMKTLKAIQEVATLIDTAVFKALGDAIRCHLPARGELLPFDVLLVGGDDIVLVTPANQALQVAATLAERFHSYTGQQYTLSIGVVLAPITYPFGLQRALADETIKAAKKAGASKKTGADDGPEQSHINFVVVTGNTSLSYESIYERMIRKGTGQGEFYATMRPYALPQFQWLLERLYSGRKERLGRTKLHQLREAILKIDRNTAATVLEALALLRNCQDQERRFVKKLVEDCDRRLTPAQRELGTLFPWGLDGERSAAGTSLVYHTPLLDFIELYDFIS